MGSFRQKAAVAVVLVGVILAVTFVVSFIVALGTGFEIYLGGMLLGWLLFAVFLPMATGVMSPREVVDNVRWRRRAGRHYEGEPLPTRDDHLAGWLGQPSRRKDSP